MYMKEEGKKKEAVHIAYNKDTERSSTSHTFTMKKKQQHLLVGLVNERTTSRFTEPTAAFPFFSPQPLELGDLRRLDALVGDGLYLGLEFLDRLPRVQRVPRQLAPVLVRFLQRHELFPHVALEINFFVPFLAVVATLGSFLDGHVEQRPRKFAVVVPGDTWLTTEQAARMDFKRLGFVCDGEADDIATRDSLYDLD